MVYGWSIGGYPASYMAMKYPNIGGVILDATFDSLLPLALPRLGKTLEPMVKTAVEENVALNVSEQLLKYPGSVRLIRRLRDEMICVDDSDFNSNRGNDLLVQLLRSRYPKLFEDSSEVALREFLFSDYELRATLEVNGEMEAFLESYMEEFGLSFPMNIGEDFDTERKNEMIKFLACKYLTDFDAGHNAALPKELFVLPWTPKTLSSKL